MIKLNSSVSFLDYREPHLFFFFLNKNKKRWKRFWRIKKFPTPPSLIHPSHVMLTSQNERNLILFYFLFYFSTHRQLNMHDRMTLKWTNMLTFSYTCWSLLKKEWGGGDNITRWNQIASNYYGLEFSLELLDDIGERNDPSRWINVFFFFSYFSVYLVTFYGLLEKGGQ